MKISIIGATFLLSTSALSSAKATEFCTHAKKQVEIKIYDSIRAIEIFENGQLVVRDEGIFKKGLWEVPCHLSASIYFGEFVRYGECTTSLVDQPVIRVSFNNVSRTYDLRDFDCRIEENVSHLN